MSDTTDINLARRILAAFEAADQSVVDLVASGDRVVARVRFSATCTGMVRDDLSMLGQIGTAEAMA